MDEVEKFFMYLGAMAFGVLLAAVLVFVVFPVALGE